MPRREKQQQVRTVGGDRWLPATTPPHQLSKVRRKDLSVFREVNEEIKNQRGLSQPATRTKRQVRHKPDLPFLLAGTEVVK
jgi:hypothetical protein